MLGCASRAFAADHCFRDEHRFVPFAADGESDAADVDVQSGAEVAEGLFQLGGEALGDDDEALAVIEGDVIGDRA
jgi:hypothetical protein